MDDVVVKDAKTLAVKPMPISPCDTCENGNLFRQFIEHTAEVQRGYNAAIMFLEHHIKSLEKKLREKDD